MSQLNRLLPAWRLAGRIPLHVWALHRNQDDRTHAGTVQGLVWTIL